MTSTARAFLQAPPLPARLQVGEIESFCLQIGRWPLVGADEVGRGPLAGPVVAAAVVLTDDAARTGWGLAGLADSKALTELQRQDLVPRIEAAAVGWAIEEGSVAEIAQYNILGASLRAMARAGRRAVAQAHHVSGMRAQLWLIDGNQRLRDCDDLEQMTVIKGDGRSRCIAAASVLAKVYRDRLMVGLDAQFPGYGLARHKGYPTPEHLAAVAALGPSSIHRLGYAPVAAAARQLGLFD